MERLRGRDEVWSGGGLTTHSVSADICQTRLRLDCGAVRVCLYRCCSMMGDTVRNILLTRVLTLSATYGSQNKIPGFVKNRTHDSVLL